MSATFDYGPFAEEDRATLTAVMEECFATKAEDVAKWWTVAGEENVRALRCDGRSIGGLLIAPMGQWFGGRSVPMAGIAGVGVGPEFRGHRAGRVLMEELVRECAASGYALSTLYASTLRLYRGVGYEQAGFYGETRGPLDRFGRGARDLAVRRLTPHDEPAVEDCYRAFAREQCGMADRGPYLWSRVRKPRGEEAIGYAIEGASGLEAYLYWRKERDPQHDYEVAVTDWAARTPESMLRLVGFLASEFSMSHTLSWHGSPASLLHLAAAERGFVTTLREHWLTRVLDVARALEARGYRRGAPAQLALRVHDPLLAQNDRTYTLSVADGTGHVEAGGEAELEIEIGALAPLYTGFVSAHQLALHGVCRGDDAALAKASALFQGAAPALADFF